MTMKELPGVVKKGHTLFFNDGLIELQVEDVKGDDIHCTVIVGGQLRPRKGLNIPGINLGSSAFTPRDRECMQFALENGVDAVGQSFVNTAQDVLDVRAAAKEMGFDPFIVAKIERASVWEHIDGILEVTDGIMVAMGDYPLESVEMLAKIAVAIEPHRLARHFDLVLKPQAKNYKPNTVDLISFSIENVIAKVDSPAGVLVPTTSGYMARSLTLSCL